ncbi:MAG: hypothetical protein H0X63_00715 [Flavobacteriales bacterium]|jgi:hypothetical protein|nr:hypothetical protein [Flavobacteriales bacterium]
MRKHFDALIQIILLILKQCIMKNLFLALVATVLFSGVSWGQKKVIDLEALGQNSTVEYKNSENLKFELKFHLGNERTTILPNLEGSNYQKVRVELYDSSKRIVHSYIDDESTNRGPNSSFNGNFMEDIPMHTAVFSEKEWWPLVLIVVACCVTAEVGSDGWSVGFDCGCIKSSSVQANVNGESFNISSVKYVPLDSNNRPIAIPTTNWSINTK